MVPWTAVWWLVCWSECSLSGAIWRLYHAPVFFRFTHARFPPRYTTRYTVASWLGVCSAGRSARWPDGPTSRLTLLPSRCYVDLPRPRREPAVPLLLHASSRYRRGSSCCFFRCLPTSRAVTDVKCINSRKTDKNVILHARVQRVRRFERVRDIGCFSNSVEICWVFVIPRIRCSRTVTHSDNFSNFLCL